MAIFRFQITYLGDSLIFIWQDLNYIISGLIKGRSALSGFFWVVGLCFLLSSFISFVNLTGLKKFKKYIGISIILSAILFLISIIVQYGLLFSGPAGIAIPIGVPVLFAIGVWIYFEGSRIGNDIHTEEDEVD